MVELEPTVLAALMQFTKDLQQLPVIKHYQHCERQINMLESLNQHIDLLKYYQKSWVHAEHYEKNRAADYFDKKISETQEALYQDPVVLAYQSALYEANEILQYFIKDIEEQLNQRIKDQFTMIKEGKDQ